MISIDTPIINGEPVMKMYVSIFVFLSSIVAYACDDDTRKRLLDARDDQEYISSPASIRSLNFDNKNINDATLHSALTKADNLITLSAQHNALQNPQPVVCKFLTKIDFTKGNIEIFRIGDWVTAAPNLEILKLAHNKISSIASDTDTDIVLCGPCGQCTVNNGGHIWRSYALQEVDLSHNALTEFDLNILNNAPNVIKADFSNNQIAEIKIPRQHRILHRQICTVLLHNNKLDQTAKAQLISCNRHITKEYEKSLRDAPVLSGIIGTGIGSSVCFGVFFGKLLVGIDPLFLVLGTVLGGAGVCALSTYVVMRTCGYQESKNTYKPFVFEFEVSKSKDQVVVELD